MKLNQLSVAEKMIEKMVLIAIVLLAILIANKGEPEFKLSKKQITSIVKKIGVTGYNTMVQEGCYAHVAEYLTTHQWSNEQCTINYKNVIKDIK